MPSNISKGKPKGADKKSTVKKRAVKTPEVQVVDEETGEVGADLVIKGIYGFRAWFQAYAWIRNKAGVDIDATLNILQKRVCDAIEWCLEHDQPIRIIILKPRQKGASTISVAAVYWFMCAMAVTGVVVGGIYKEVKNMWKILERYSLKDKFNWRISKKINQDGASFGNGANLEKETARNRNAGRSATIQAMLATEAARWQDGEAAPPEVVIQGLLSCMDDLPQTLGIIDSTAEGASGFYYSKWEKAQTLDARKMGRTGNGWIQVFAGWWEFSDSLRPLECTAAEFQESMTAKERALQLEYQLTPEHINWRRFIIEDKCDGDENKFNMDYPGKPSDAFKASRPSCFNSKALDILRERALVAGSPLYGSFHQPNPNDNRFIFEPCNKDDSHQVVIYEQPIVGCRYNFGVDTMTGEQSEGGNPDNHAGTIVREGFWDERGAWRPPKVVARIGGELKDNKNLCHWYIHILEDVVFAMSAHYGMCQIVPEVNMDAGLTTSLVNRGANVYIRNTEDELGNERYVESKERYGFKTKAGGENARKHIIENLKKVISEVRHGKPGEGIEIVDLAILGELETFIVNLKGKPEAALGSKDDLVMALAITMATMAGATKYTPKARVDRTPPDIQKILNRRGGKRRSQYS